MSKLHISHFIIYGLPEDHSYHFNYRWILSVRGWLKKQKRWREQSLINCGLFLCMVHYQLRSRWFIPSSQNWLSVITWIERKFFGLLFNFWSREFEFIHSGVELSLLYKKAIEVIIFIVNKQLTLQLKAFDSTPHGCRKVVVATNIAETSVTIPGIAYGNWFFPFCGWCFSV